MLLKSQVWLHVPVISVWGDGGQPSWKRELPIQLDILSQGINTKQYMSIPVPASELCMDASHPDYSHGMQHTHILTHSPTHTFAYSLSHIVSYTHTFTHVRISTHFCTYVAIATFIGKTATL